MLTGYSQRRRTQIRLAQRAYRLRKEGVISSLNRRVADLEKTVDEMSRTFLAFNDEAMSSDILAGHPGLARQLRHATERFLALAKVAEPETAHGDDNDNDPDATEPTRSIQSPEPQQDRYESVPNRALTPRTLAKLTKTCDTANQGNCMLQPGDPLHLSSDDPSQQCTGYSILDSMFTSGLAMFQGPPTPQSTNSLTPATFASRETSFGRRIHRRCLERGYYLLSDPTSSVSDLERKFRFSFEFANRFQLAQAFRYLLQKNCDEPLEFWNKPFYTIGGAGMHFPRKDEFGIAVYPPNLHPPEKAMRVLSPDLPAGAHPYRRVDEIIDAAGYDGEWFDCHDIEGYLASKGLSPDGSLSYIDVPASSPLFPLNVYSPPSSALAESTLPSSSMHPAAPTTSIPQLNGVSDPAPLSYQLLPACFYSQQNQTGVQALNLLGINRETLSGLENYSNLMHQPNTSAGMFPNRRAVLDVDRFIEGKISLSLQFPALHKPCYVGIHYYIRKDYILTTSQFLELVEVAVCLGRAPGIRRRDMEAALAASISPSY